ncbi:MAG: DNA-processing protein DprA, partial [Micrococcales bacterium]
HQPVLLWYRGNPENFSALNKSVGVVGSRNASHYGQRITAELVSTAVAENATVVSGGALGIDSVAHRATLGLNGVTVAFMAGSLDKPYPAANLQLFDEISHSGLLLSEMVPGSNPTRWRFLQRNRLIAAVSNALVVTEAGLRSGSINTVNHAAELDRPIYAIPGPITSPSSAGCNALIRDQLADILVDVSELPEELGWRPIQLSKTDSMGSLELRALDALTGKAQHFEEIRSLSGLTSIELRVALGGLQLLGLAHGLGDQTWRKINPQRT